MVEAEVVYAVHHEFCEHPEDFIARRTRLAFIDTAATQQALPRVRRSSSLPKLRVVRIGHRKMHLKIVCTVRRASKAGIN